MPVILVNEIEDGKIGLWKITEEVYDLENSANLSEEDKLTCSGIKAIHRKKEWLATRVLLNELTGNHNSIKYFTDGRPYPANGEFNLSISHTTGFVAVIIHPTLIPGIDLELISRPVGRVARRFLSSEEYDACTEANELSNHKLLLHWCAKEAIFKIVPFSDIEFSTDILISLNKNNQKARLFQGIFKNHSDQISIPLEYLEIEEVLVVWAFADKFNFSNKNYS